MAKVKVLRSRAARLRGLIGHARSSDIVLLTPCSDVHTFMMRYPIDVAFIDRNACIIAAYRNVEPGSRLRCRRACAVAERAADSSKKWFTPQTFAGGKVYRAIRERKSL